VNRNSNSRPHSVFWLIGGFNSRRSTRWVRNNSSDLRPSNDGDIDRYLVRDAQRVIESIEALVRIHNVQEEDIYNASAAA